MPQISGTKPPGMAGAVLTEKRSGNKPPVLWTASTYQTVPGGGPHPHTSSALEA
ncbi:MAG: hypothetical protein RIT45_3326 [Pseudomonadota bacterium]|jgi:hypothetical protein